MLNNTIISGRLTKDPELKYVTEKQIPVLNFTLAVERDPFDGNSEKKTDFIPVVAWNGIARFISEHFGKGGSLTVQGRIQSRSWDDQEGKKHYAVELIADKAYFSGNSKRNDETVAESEVEEYSA
jgi:single-strand DNA-binding protein